MVEVESPRKFGVFNEEERATMVGKIDSRISMDRRR